MNYFIPFFNAQLIFTGRKVGLGKYGGALRVNTVYTIKLTQSLGLSEELLWGKAPT